MTTLTPTGGSWLLTARRHAQSHTLAFVSLSIGLLAVLTQSHRAA